MVDAFLEADLSIEPYGTEVVSLVTRWLEQRKKYQQSCSPVACEDHRREKHTNEAMLKLSDLIYILSQLLIIVKWVGNIRKYDMMQIHDHSNIWVLLMFLTLTKDAFNCSKIK